MPSEPEALSPQRIEQRLIALSVWLSRWRYLWEPRPFQLREVPWEREHPALRDWLTALPLEAVDRHHAEPSTLADAPEPLASCVAGARARTRVPRFAGTPASLGRRWRVGVPARKRKQIAAFVAPAIEGAGGARSWVDWCAGKGHLGRALGPLAERPVEIVERRQSLCAQAAARAREEGVEMTTRCRDVLAGPVPIAPESAIAALHACGALSDAAIAAAVRAGARRLAVSPCCYHHQPGQARLPVRSAIGRAHPLDVAPSQLRLVTAEEIAAPPRRRRRRRRQEAFRLGLDLLLREARGEDACTELPPIPHAWFRTSFEAFARRVAGEAGLPLPRFDSARAEARGWARAAEVARKSLVRVCFRRALETWVVLDRAAWLAESGYAVEVVTFCERADSPRNLLIVADRPT